MSALERDIQHEIRIALGQDRRLVIWRNNTGTAERAIGTRTVRMRYGLCVGSADLVGIVTLPSGVGRFIALEVKQSNGRTTEEQDMFLALVRRMGGFAAVVRSVDEARAAIDRAVAGASE